MSEKGIDEERVERARRFAIKLGVTPTVISLRSAIELEGEHTATIRVSDDDFRMVLLKQKPSEVRFHQGQTFDEGTYYILRFLCGEEDSERFILETCALPYAHFAAGVLDNSFPYRMIVHKTVSLTGMRCGKFVLEATQP